VVGGGDKGGILVRKALELNSAAEAGRLETGSLIKQICLEGDRLQYQKCTGEGPASGWVSIKIQGKSLVEKTSKRPPPTSIPIWEGAAEDGPLSTGEISAEDCASCGVTKLASCAGFAKRAATDPLHEWIPLRQVLPLGSRRQIVCIGPPSVDTSDWAAPDVFGSWENSSVTGNALAQLARNAGDELLLIQSGLAVDRDGWALELANLLVQRLQSTWIGVGVGVGAWQLAMFMNALLQIGDDGNKAVKNCGCMHVVGFPHPETGIGSQRPKGLDDIDWKFAQSAASSELQSFRVPNDLSVYYLSGDDVVSQEQVHAWFKFQPSLQDGAAKSAYPIFGLQGDHDLLRQPWRRTEFFWALANHTWGSSHNFSIEDVSVYQKTAALLGHGRRSISLFDEANDAVLATLDRDSNMLPIPNVNLREGQCCVNENWTSGNAAAGIGLDIRMYANMASQASSCVGCQIVCAVRFGNNPGIGVRPGAASGVHGGAIQSVMDEITAQCVRYWAAPACTTRKINHIISGRVFQFQTYRCKCEIEKIQDDGCVYVSCAKLMDPLGKVVCTSRADMLDLPAMIAMQKS